MQTISTICQSLLTISAGTTVVVEGSSSTYELVDWLGTTSYDVLRSIKTLVLILLVYISHDEMN